MVTFLKRYHDRFHGTDSRRALGGANDSDDPVEFTIR